MILSVDLSGFDQSWYSEEFATLCLARAMNIWSLLPCCHFTHSTNPRVFGVIDVGDMLKKVQRRGGVNVQEVVEQKAEERSPAAVAVTVITQEPEEPVKEIAVLTPRVEAREESGNGVGLHKFDPAKFSDEQIACVLREVELRKAQQIGKSAEEMIALLQKELEDIDLAENDFLKQLQERRQKRLEILRRLQEAIEQAKREIGSLVKR